MLLTATGCGELTEAPSGPDGSPLWEGLIRGDPAWSQLVDEALVEGEVVVRSVFPEAIELDLFQRFEEVSGIRVSYSRKGGSAPTLQTYLTEVAAGQHLADVLQLEVSIAASMPTKERLLEFKVPNESNYLGRYREWSPGAHPVASLGVPIVYNRNLMDEKDLPRTYEELAHPRYRSKLAMGSPENSSNIVGLLFLWEQQFGVSWLESLAANDPLDTDREVEAANFIARGERLLGPMSQTSPSAQIEAGAPLGYHWVPGTKLDAYVAVVPEAAPHPNAARLFVNFLLSFSHQQSLAHKLRAFPVVSGVSGPEGFPDLEALDPVSFDVQTFNENRERVIARWRSILR